MDITILIINWNSGDYLGQLLDSLQGLEGWVTGVLVLDNDSRDHSIEAVSAFPWVECERLERNTGFAAAVNRGFGAIDSKYVLLVNPDVVFENSHATAAGLYQAAEEADRMAIVTCPMNSVDPAAMEAQAEFQVRPYPSVGNTLFDLLFLDEIFGKRGNRTGAGVKGMESGLMELDQQPAAALWLVRKSAWEEAGGLDERFYPAWFEDVDFCRRIRELGWKIGMVKSSERVLHQGGSSLETLGFSRFLGIYYRNLLRYWWKHHKLFFPAVAIAAGVGYAARRILILTGVLFKGK